MTRANSNSEWILTYRMITRTLTLTNAIVFILKTNAKSLSTDHLGKAALCTRECCAHAPHLPHQEFEIDDL